MTWTSYFLAAAVAVSASSPRAPVTPRAPATGLDLLRVMHDAYSGKWYTTLTFTQKTTTRRRDGVDTVTTWYEGVRFDTAKGTQLRIDIGDPAAGNGVLYSADSLLVMRAGELVATRAGGNALLPLIEGVYVQPVARTVAELAATKVDLARRVVDARWHDRPVWIVGATSAADTTSPQFWVDVERNAVVRAILVPVPSAPVMDIRLEDLVPLAGGWLATKCEFYVAGVRAQEEEYQDWKANVDLSPALFDTATWTTARHWVKR
jgi:hypothetical protein